MNKIIPWKHQKRIYIIVDELTHFNIDFNLEQGQSYG